MNPKHKVFCVSNRAVRRARAAARVAKILAPVNFSAESKKALRYARMFGHRFGAAITLLHVVEPKVRAADYGYGTVTTCCPNPPLVKNAETKLRALAKRRPRPDSEWAVLVRTGVAEREILEAARAMDADLIVMGGHHKRDASQGSICSTAERVVRDAACPVLVVRDKESRLQWRKKTEEPT